jgi:trans-aconitate 2-methyltransferase
MSPREWDARVYHELSQPQFEWGTRVLSTLDLRGDEIVMDAGCGTGRLTALLADRVPDGYVVAVDRSENMVHVAAETLTTRSARAAIALADVVNLPFRAVFDVVFSTATFHWVLDHDALFESLYEVLAPGGRLHAQCGGGPNLERIHQRANALRDSGDFAPAFANFQEPWEFASAETTRQRLERAGFENVVTSIEPAPAAFPNARAFRDFISVVVLRPFLARLGDERLRMAFVDAITVAAASDDPPYELDYWRLNIRAQRPE